MTSVSLGPFGEPLDYSRQRTFGYPFIGEAPLLPNDELINNSKLVYRFGYGVFSTANRNKRIYNRTYGEIMEQIANNQFKLLHRTEFTRGDDGHYEVYIEWVEPYHLMKNQMMPPRIEEEENPTVTSDRSVSDKIDKLPVSFVKPIRSNKKKRKELYFPGF